MARQVYLENWQEQLEESIADVELRIGPFSSVEQDVLLDELERLRELVRQVRDVEPEDRQLVKSVILPLAATEQLQFSSDLVSRLAELFDIYRRFRTRLSWNND